ncbi:MAG: PEP-CTERM sorting domain-containing protein [Planctomycetota bacterium]
MKRTTLSLITCVSMATGAGTASAGIITFDPADGYALGSSLVTGPGWSGNGSLFSITSLSGGNGAAQSQNVNAPFNENRFTPDAAFLGGSTAATGQYEYSFDLRSDSAPASEDFSTAFILRIGQDVTGTTGDAIRLNIFDNGRMQLVSGGSSINIAAASGNNFDLDDAAGRFIPVEGVIDFDTNTYTMDFDGVTQTAAGGSVNIPFSSTGQDEFGRFLLAFGNSADDPHRGITIDNLSAAVPEPGSLALFGLGGVAMLVRRR